MPEIIFASDGEDKKNNMEILSFEVQEIISKRPGRVVRNGMTFFMLIIVFLIGITFFISYPDIINANAKLTSVNAPKEIKSNTEGRLVKLLGKEGQQVQENEIIGYIESRAAHAEVIALSKITDSIQFILSANPENLTASYTKIYSDLGELQQPYQVFIQALNNFKQYLSSGYYVRQKNMLRGDLFFLNRLHCILDTQKLMEQQDLILAGKNFDASKSLSNDKVIADVEFRNEQSKLIAKQMTIPQINASLVNNESSRHEKEKEIAQLENEIAQQKAVFEQALNTFKAQIDDWKNKYLLIAPVAGTLAFTEPLQEQVFLNRDKTICFINPGNTSYYATVNIPQYNFGKIRKGEKVLLKLNAYPYQEFGTIEGRLDFISSIPTDSGFVAKIILPDGLMTNYKKQLQYREGFSAQAEIITEDQKLSDRLFKNLRSAVKN